jgi:hypothetical protein
VQAQPPVSMVISQTPAQTPAQMIISDTPLNLVQTVLQPKQGGGQSLSPIIEENEQDDSINILTLNDLISDTMTPFNVDTKRGNSDPFLTPATPVETPLPLPKNVVVKRGNQAATLTPATPVGTPQKSPSKSKQESINAGELVVVQSKKDKKTSKSKTMQSTPTKTGSTPVKKKIEVLDYGYREI